MREICTSGSEGGVAQTNAPSLPLSSSVTLRIRIGKGSARLPARFAGHPCSGPLQWFYHLVHCREPMSGRTALRLTDFRHAANPLLSIRRRVLHGVGERAQHLGKSDQSKAPRAVPPCRHELRDPITRNEKHGPPV